ncbi:hypothetical protein TrRE_jg12115, partial [Triparma retinervis]
MGTFSVLTSGKVPCGGIARYRVDGGGWGCIADPRFEVEAGMEGNMVVTGDGVMVMGRAGGGSEWEDGGRPYAIA